MNYGLQISMGPPTFMNYGLHILMGSQTFMNYYELWTPNIDGSANL